MERLEGERVYLRQLAVSDVDGPYYKWMNDPDIVRFLESRFSKNDKPSMKKFVQNALKNKDIVFLAIVLKDGDRHIGNIKLGPVNRHHNNADIGILIGEKDCWGKGYATDAIRLLADYAFQELKLHKLTAGCYSNNLGSARAFEKAGFGLEGRRKEQWLCEGKYVDGLLFGRVNPKG